jgi:hypothetical protein
MPAKNQATPGSRRTARAPLHHRFGVRRLARRRQLEGGEEQDREHAGAQQRERADPGASSTKPLTVTAAMKPIEPQSRTRPYRADVDLALVADVMGQHRLADRHHARGAQHQEDA